MPSRNPAIRDIELQAAERARASGIGSPDEERRERFAIRNELRADAGLGKEKRQRGGLAGAYDRNKQFIAPLALAAAPWALPAIGGALGIGGGAAAAGGAGAAGAAGGLAPAALGGGGLGGLLSKGKDWLFGQGGQNALGLATGITGVLQQNRGNEMAEQAAAADRARWQAGVPLREAGMAGLLAPAPLDTSSLRGLAGVGNPFAPALPDLGPPSSNTPPLLGSGGSTPPLEPQEAQTTRRTSPRMAPVPIGGTARPSPLAAVRKVADRFGGQF